MMVEKANRKLGEVIGNTYYTYRNITHFFRKYNGFGISDDLLLDLKIQGVIDVVIVYNGIAGLKRYYCKLKQYLESEKTWVYEDPFKRFGGEPDLQRFVSIEDMIEEKKV